MRAVVGIACLAGLVLLFVAAIVTLPIWGPLALSEYLVAQANGRRGWL